MRKCQHLFDPWTLPIRVLFAGENSHTHYLFESAVVCPSGHSHELLGWSNKTCGAYFVADSCRTTDEVKSDWAGYRYAHELPRLLQPGEPAHTELVRQWSAAIIGGIEVVDDTQLLQLLKEVRRA